MADDGWRMAGREDKMVLDLLKALGEVREANFVVRNADALSELLGPLRVTEDGGWATLEREGCLCHIHLRVEQIAEARFVEEPGFGPGIIAYCVQLFHVGGDRPVLMVYLPAEGYRSVLGEFGGREVIPLQPGSGTT